MSTPDLITLSRTDSSHPSFQYLIGLLDRDLQERYGDLQSEYDRYNAINNIDTVVIAYRDEAPVGCGCFKKLDEDTAEIKRMFVKPEERGRGIASRLLVELELWAKESGFVYTMLETGTGQPEAIALYQKLGYTIIPNYAQYSGMEGSVCFSKEL
jgi:putative acetyltransferase